jgi:lipopolysaccharide assembly outer membrane protein LptD (OstA)
MVGLFFFFLAAHFGGVKADTVDYNADSLHAKGQVMIQNEFGKVTCNDAVLLKDAKNTTPEKIFLKEQVFVVMQDGSTIEADSAELDCSTLEGVFRATLPNQVIATTMRDEPMKTTAQDVWIKLKKEQGKFVVTDMKGTGTVTVEYLNQGKST